MCACLRRISSLLTLKIANNKAIPNTHWHFLNIIYCIVHLYAPLQAKRFVIAVPTNPVHAVYLFVVLRVFLLGWDVPCFIPFLLAFRSYSLTKSSVSIFSSPPVVCYCCSIAVSHQLIALCLSSISAVFVVILYRYLLLLFCYFVIFYCFFLYILCVLYML